MASQSSSSFLLFSSLLFSIISLSISQPSFRPKALLLPVTKDSSTRQYHTQINQRTPLVPLKLALDLGSAFLWVDCEQGYVSSTRKRVRCQSAQCNLAESKACSGCSSTPNRGCSNGTCVLFPNNPITRVRTSGDVAQDVVSIPSTDGFKPGRAVSMPNMMFTCAPSFLLKGLAAGVKGMAGLGRSKIGLPSQFSAAFSFSRKFAVCLSPSKGVVFFGDGPYVFHGPGNVDLSKSLTYTPLFINPASTAGSFFAGQKSVEYFIGVKSILISQEAVRLNTSLLSIDSKGNGGTKISTVNPYMVLETSIYNAVVNAFVKSLGTHVRRVAAVPPFGACFNLTEIGHTPTGPGVPDIDLVLQSKNVYWRIYGANSMVEVGREVVCLGLVDGGAEPRTSIVIGGHQLEDNLLQFDLDANRLGFSNSLLFTPTHSTTCSNFNFKN